MIKQAILDKVTKDDHVTFAEITRMDGCGGDYELLAILVQIGGVDRGEVIDADDVSDKLITSTYDQTVSC